MSGDHRPGTARGHALILTGGPLPLELGPLPDAEMVIAADEGIDNARQLGMPVDLLVGDLDSASDGSEAFAGSVQRHPVDKDQTDLELALAAALAAGQRGAQGAQPRAGRGEARTLATARLQFTAMLAQPA